MTWDPTNVFEPVVAYLPSIVVILPPKPLVVVATDELKSPIEELSPDVVVATDPDKEPIELLKSDVTKNPFSKKLRVTSSPFRRLAFHRRRLVLHRPFQAYLQQDIRL